MELSLLAVTAMALLGVFAGWLGSIVGIGGGLVIVPVLVLGFGFDIRVAVATSLVAVVATSTAAGSSLCGAGPGQHAPGDDPRGGDDDRRDHGWPGRGASSRRRCSPGCSPC
jgi:hypothetical protein